MFSKMMVSIVLFFSAMAANAQPMSATEILNQIHREYSQRFDSNNKYIDDQNLTNKFKASQLSAIETLRRNKMIGQSFQIRNSAMSDLVVTVSIIQEQNSNFAGLLIQRNKYDSPNAEALLRLFNFPILTGGMTLLSLDGATVIQIKSYSINAESGGTVLLKYPKDFNNNQFEQTALAISRTQNSFTFLSPNSASFSTLNLNVWFNIFSQNFGVKSATFQ